MGLGLRLLGAGLILAAAIFIYREYSAFVDRRIASLKSEDGEGSAEELDRAEKNKMVAKALLIGGALAIGIMVV